MGNDSGIEIGLDTLTINGDPTKLYEELAAAQAEFVPVPKANTGQIGQQKFKYAGYAKLMRCVRPALSAHGITLIQPLHSREDMAVTTTIIAGHGASIVSSFSFKAEFSRKQKDGTVIDDPQEFGRHHTYYRRYQLQAMLGIEGDSDADDLPDVNEEPAQYREPARDATTGEAVPAKAATAPKAKVSAATKSAPAVQPTLPSVAPSEVTTPSIAKPAVVAESAKTINTLLMEAIQHLKWEMPELKAFYIEHVDKAGFDKAANLKLEQKQALFGKLVEHKGVIPF
jgi:hypothetical protein